MSPLKKRGRTKNNSLSIADRLAEKVLGLFS
jgi:hypothetical protein